MVLFGKTENESFPQFQSYIHTFIYICIFIYSDLWLVIGTVYVQVHTPIQFQVNGKKKKKDKKDFDSFSS